MSEVGQSSTHDESHPGLLPEIETIMVLNSQPNTASMSIEAAAKQHVQLIDRFTRLVAMIKRNKKGLLDSMFLADAEWSFRHSINRELWRSTRLIIPPPWEIALLWYCHLLCRSEPQPRSRNQRDRPDGNPPVELCHLPFSLSLMSTVGWTAELCYQKSIPYHLWRMEPWRMESTPRPLVVHQHLTAAAKAVWMWIRGSHWGGSIVEPRTSKCHATLQTGFAACIFQRGFHEFKPRTISLRKWRDHRTGKRPFKCKRCRSRRRDLDGWTRCTFEHFNSPWLDLGELQKDLANLMVFWKSTLEIKDLRADAGDSGANPNGIARSCQSYFRFMGLLREYALCEPHDGSRFVPTPEISVIWHTHRLFRTDYEQRCMDYIGRYVDFDPSLTRERMEEAYESTAAAWKRKYGSEYGDCRSSGGVSSPSTCIPEAAWLWTRHDSSTISREKVTDRTARDVAEVEICASESLRGAREGNDDCSVSGGSYSGGSWGGGGGGDWYSD